MLLKRGSGADSDDFAVLDEDFFDRSVEADFDSGFIEVVLEDCDDVLGGLVNREDSAVGTGVDLEPPIGEHRNNFAIGESVDGGADEVGFVLAEGADDVADGAVVGDVALPSPGDQDLGADPARFFKDEDLLSEGRRSPGGKDSCRSGSDHDDVGFH